MTEEQAVQPKTVYHAVLCIHGVVLPPAEMLNWEPFQLPIGDGHLKLIAPFQARKYWSDNGFPEGQQSLMLYPRTDDEGYLAPGTLLRRVRKLASANSSLAFTPLGNSPVFGPIWERSP